MEQRTIRADTIPGLFCARVAASGDRPALHVRRGDRFEPVSWNALAGDVLRAAAALVELGVMSSDRVALISPNRYEWIVSDLAIQLARGVHVPIHVSLSGPQIAYQILDCGARVVLLAGLDQAAKLADYAARQPNAFPAETRFLSFDACPSQTGPFRVQRFCEPTETASEGLARDVQQAALDHLRPDDLATILYTSGTTGEPKGVMLSQRNLASNATATVEAFCQYPNDVRLTWLPLSHIFARTCDLYTWVVAGSELALAGSPETVIADCALVHPTLINGVPYFFEKVERSLMERGLADEPGSLIEVFGGRLRAGCSGGAPLPDHVASFFQRHGVLLLQGYGLTESSPVIAACTEKANKLGTVGRPIPGVEVKISPEGEVLTRGPHVMLGYWKRPQETAEVLVDGWLHTGDLGELDDEGFLRITGRKKELIVTAAGKNIAPAYLEALLTADPLIQQAVVIGDRRSYLSALIVPDLEALKAELERRHMQIKSAAELLADPQVKALYADRINERLADVSHYEQVRRFTLLDRCLSVDRGELTFTMKLRRQTILTNFADQIEAMYSETPAGSSGR